jgi:drug/metabolite transporter (DMT)-like permease
VSLLVAIPCGIASAVAYGLSTAVEHSAVNASADPATTAGDETSGGGIDAGRLIGLIRNPRWLMGMAGDTLGLVLQVIALSTGPVVLIQPLLILALPISLPIAWLLGGPRPRRPEYLSCALIIAGLGAFFILVGDPGTGDVLRVRPAVATVVVVAVAGLAALAIVRRAQRGLKAAIYGAVAGAWFGLVAVLMDAASTAWRSDGLSAFSHATGLVPLTSLVLLGAASIVLTQISFQIGALAASFPANLSADPVLAVALGALLLHEDLPLSVLHLLAYALCLGAVLFGAIRLAAAPLAPAPAVSDER